MDTPPGTGLLDVVAAGGRSVVSRAYATSPLRILMPRNHGRAAWVYTGSYGGGLVDGDAVRLTLRVGAGAAAFLSTQASTKVYRSTVGTSVDIDAQISSGGRLVWWPDPVVCFAGSRYQQRQHFELASGTAIVLVDCMTSGRRSTGERWQFVRYANRLTVRYDGRLVLLDSLALSAEDGDLPARMGRFDVLCTVTIAGPPLHEPIARILGDMSRRPISRKADVLVAAAPLSDVGCVLRIAGRSVEQVGRLVRDSLSFVTGLLGDDPWARKW